MTTCSRPCPSQQVGIAEQKETLLLCSWGPTLVLVALGVGWRDLPACLSASYCTGVSMRVGSPGISLTRRVRSWHTARPSGPPLPCGTASQCWWRLLWQTEQWEALLGSLAAARSARGQGKITCPHLPGLIACSPMSLLPGLTAPPRGQGCCSCWHIGTRRCLGWHPRIPCSAPWRNKSGLI